MPKPMARGDKRETAGRTWARREERQAKQRPKRNSGRRAIQELDQKPCGLGIRAAARRSPVDCIGINTHIHTLIRYTLSFFLILHTVPGCPI